MPGQHTEQAFETAIEYFLTTAGGYERFPKVKAATSTLRKRCGWVNGLSGRLLSARLKAGLLFPRLSDCSVSRRCRHLMTSETAWE